MSKLHPLSPRACVQSSPFLPTSLLAWNAVNGNAAPTRSLSAENHPFALRQQSSFPSASPCWPLSPFPEKASSWWWWWSSSLSHHTRANCGCNNSRFQISAPPFYLWALCTHTPIPQPGRKAVLLFAAYRRASSEICKSQTRSGLARGGERREVKSYLLSALRGKNNRVIPRANPTRAIKSSFSPLVLLVGC